VADKGETEIPYLNQYILLTLYNYMGHGFWLKPKKNGSAYFPLSGNEMVNPRKTVEGTVPFITYLFFRSIAVWNHPAAGVKNP
jgi:hypothetical protein